MLLYLKTRFGNYSVNHELVKKTTRQMGSRSCSGYYYTDCFRMHWIYGLIPQRAGTFNNLTQRRSKLAFYDRLLCSYTSDL